MTETTPQARRDWPAWMVWLPGSIAVLTALAFGTAGALMLIFGLGLACAEQASCGFSCHRCDALDSWLQVGITGQWVIAAAAAVVLIAGLARRAWRRPAVIVSCGLLGAAPALFAVTALVGEHLS